MDPYFDLTGNTQRLDPDFLAKLVALGKVVGKLNVDEGFRTRAQQAAGYAAKPGIVAPPGKSLHEVGLAADLSGNLDKAHALAAQYGLRFPMGNEPWHIQPVGARRTPNGASNMPAPTISLHPWGFQPDRQQPGGSSLNLDALIERLMTPLPPDPRIAYLQNRIAQHDPFAASQAAQPEEADSYPLPWMTNVAQFFENRKAQAQPPISPVQRMLNAYTAQGAAQGSPYEEAAIKAGAAGEAKTQMSQWDAANPPPQAQPLQFGAYPQREQVAIPERGQPQLNPIAGIGAALLGIVDPQNAGGFGAAALHGAINARDQDYADMQRKYQETVQQKSAQYEDALGQHNESIRQQILNAQIAGTNANANYQSMRNSQLEGIGGAEQTSVGKQLGEIKGTGPEDAEVKASVLNLGAHQHAQDIDSREVDKLVARGMTVQQARNALAAHIAQTKETTAASRYRADQILQGIKDRVAAMERVGSGHDAARITAAFTALQGRMNALASKPGGKQSTDYAEMQGVQRELTKARDELTKNRQYLANETNPEKAARLEQLIQYSKDRVTAAEKALIDFQNRGAGGSSTGAPFFGFGGGNAQPATGGKSPLNIAPGVQLIPR